MVWCGEVRCGVVWYGLVWCGRDDMESPSPRCPSTIHLLVSVHAHTSTHARTHARSHIRIQSHRHGHLLDAFTAHRLPLPSRASTSPCHPRLFFPLPHCASFCRRVNPLNSPAAVVPLSGAQQAPLRRREGGLAGRERGGDVSGGAGAGFVGSSGCRANRPTGTSALSRTHAPTCPGYWTCT